MNKAVVQIKENRYIQGLRDYDTIIYEVCPTAWHTMTRIIVATNTRTAEEARLIAEEYLQANNLEEDTLLSVHWDGTVRKIC